MTRSRSSRARGIHVACEAAASIALALRLNHRADADCHGRDQKVISLSLPALLLPCRPPLADEPDFFAWHALHTVIEHPVLMAVRNADTASRKETGQPTFGASPPSDPLPFPFDQQGFSRDRGLIRDMAFARLSCLRDGEHQGDVGGIDVGAAIDLPPT